VGKTKIKRSTPEQVERKRVEARNREVIAAATFAGVPETQRDPTALTLVDTAIDDKIRVASKTVRKLTRVELLQKRGTLEPYQAAACAFYVSSAEAASAGVVQATCYGDSSGGSPISAAVGQHATLIVRAANSVRHDAVRRAIPRPYLASFEAIVLDCQSIMAVGSAMHPEASRGKISTSMRALVKVCADCIWREFEAEACALYVASSEEEMPRVDGPSKDRRQSLLDTMVRFDRQIAAERPVEDAVGPVRPISLALDEVILRAAVEGATGLLVAASVVATLARENGLPADMVSYGGLPLIVQEHWNWGWVVQKAVVGEAA
jgi:hypothetical protein